MAKYEEVTALPNIVVNSVPKSGTNLLIQLILGIPGIKVSKLSPVGFYKQNFNSLRKLQNGEMAYGHFPYRPRFARRLRKWDVKQLFISRDPRDVVVSMTHFILDKYPEHHLYRYFTNHLSTHEERLLASIEGVNRWNLLKSGSHWRFGYPSVYEEYKQIYEWAGVPGVCRVTFEELLKSQESQDRALMRIVNFLWDDLQRLSLDKYHLIRLMKQNIDPHKSWTFRKGEIGGWRDEFNEEHKAAFKRTAGELLIQLGYEKDMNW
jgi:hypothetical protein